MKIEEAKEKWCPFANPSGLQGYPTENRAVLKSRGAHTRCIAIDCMSWRWTKNCVDGVNSSTVTIVSETDGYCGLAGKE
jgi:hypothetical protein